MRALCFISPELVKQIIHKLYGFDPMCATPSFSNLKDASSAGNENSLFHGDGIFFVLERARIN